MGLVSTIMLNFHRCICTTHKFIGLVLTGISLFAVYVSYFPGLHIFCLSSALVLSMN